MNSDPDMVLVPIPLRESVTARVHFPLDLTPAEARKIGAVVAAYAQQDPPKAQRPAPSPGRRAGGLARAARLTSEERIAIARRAAQARWGRRDKP